MTLRPATIGHEAALFRAVGLLRQARDLIKFADCPHTLRRVRLCLTSAGGAQRHMRGRLMRGKAT